MNIITCSVCGFPITRSGCVHTALGISADEWRARRAAALTLAQSSNPRSTVTGCVWIALLGVIAAALLLALFVAPLLTIR